MEEILTLLRENNRLLKEVLSILATMNSTEYRSNEDMRAFSINVCADIFVSMLEEDSEIRNKVKDNLINKTK